MCSNSYDDKPKVESFDHLVLTVADLHLSERFYIDTLGMESIRFGDGRKKFALKFGTQKINLHEKDKELKPSAFKPTSGSSDICFLSKNPLSVWLEHLKKIQVKIEEGPIMRTGAIGPINSIYIRDPDQNLIEISNQC